MMPYSPCFFFNINFPTVYLNTMHKKLQMSSIHLCEGSLLSCFDSAVIIAIAKHKNVLLCFVT